MMIIRGVNVFPSQIEEILLKEKASSPHYQLELIHEGNMDGLIVNVEAIPDVSSEERATLAKQLQQQIKDFIGISTVVNVVGEGDIPRPEGKVQRVVDKR